MDSTTLTSLPAQTWLSDRGITCVLFFAPLLVLMLSVAALNGGEFFYTLDDPYIHLTLARQIFNGHYGINPTEFSAPSSSILWPFILAPFGFLGTAMYKVPLVLNLIFSFFTFRLLLQMLQGVSVWPKILILVGWLLATNFYGLIFNGMEHCLQVFLTIAIAKAVVDKEFRGYPVTSLVYGAIVLLPLVRYEGLAISMPVLLYLLIKGDAIRAQVCGAVIVLLVTGFSLFLDHIGMGWLPSSVIAKSDTSGIKSIVLNAISQFEKYGWVIVLMLVMCGFFIQRRALVMLLVSVTALHVLLGKYGWYGRYEIYWLSFLGVFFLHWALTSLKPGSVALIFGLLPLAFAPLVYATFSTPLAARAIHNQQYALAMIASELDQPVAVNDLGLVALNSQRYVLDLWGLGSLEALKLRKSQSGPEWIQTLMDKKNVHYAFVYDDWFTQHPTNWIKVADLQLTVPKIAAALDTVAFYATDSESAHRLRMTMKAYQAAHPEAKFNVAYQAE
ncbi:hypothetical protein [Pseudomonas sp. LP_7_YM]|uniref:hypothetical protein n=1 Tax=Pseudomonas sp. LP_7_YM TaxID=2485137 RepID=UPI00106081DF|nr:hypothetical protein [Pseudomonas sp. LP_7_YM]TDV64309.1 hypothetical protein EC915_10512 [Pseudomonas sp. LP_7_YM]